MHLTIKDLIKNAIRANDETKNALTSILVYIDASEDIRAKYFLATQNGIELPQNKNNVVLFDEKNKKETKQEMPPIYADGTFRQKGKSLEYRFMHEDKQQSVYGKSKEECWNKRTEIIIGKAKLKNKKPELLYSDWLDEWVITYKKADLKETSYSQLERYIKNDLKPFFKKNNIKKINALDLQKYLNTLNDKPNKKYKIALILKESLHQATILKLIKDNPFLHVKMPSLNSESFNMLEYIEQETILNSIDDIKYKAYFYIMSCTGIRPGEFFKINFNNDINYEHMMLHIRGTKTKKSNRYIPFTKTLKKYLILYTEAYNNNDRIDKDKVSRYFLELFRNNNINAVLYSFRHTFASVAYNCKISEKQIQAWMGHSTLDMTLNVYTELLQPGTSFLKCYMIELKEQLKL